MKYFCGYTPWDFPIAQLDPYAHMLVSPTTYSPTYRYDFHPPQEVMLDSGAFHHGRRNTHRHRLRTLHDQLKIAEQYPGSTVTLAHSDVLLRPEVDPRRSIHETLVNAEWFMRQDLPSGYRRMTVAQARTPDEMYLVVSQLAQFEPELIGIGGLANLHRTHRKLLPFMLEGAVEAAGDLPLHALGVTAQHILQRLRINNIYSCDSATAIWCAIYGSVVYARPYRRYRLISEKSSRPESPQETGYYSSLTRPLACTCPVCRTVPEELLGSDSRAKYARYIHNYYHIKLEIEGEGEWQAVYSSAEYQSVMTTFLSSRSSSNSTQA
ncbi:MULTISPECIES: hypothetical protein [unclassified Deinococcus]|uniref:hypothetical protein n=1 Tax=unclassified Deinococcus TaxID=2623546 RepID=UPI0011811337|nr:MULTISPECIES: hypothetical protein [unclassified Deinococcus]MCD0160879.1 hypothetical protein [Deinococcus sp. 6YEL10]